MFVIFCIAEIIAGFCLLVFGAGMIESPDTITMLLGSMIAFVGLIVMAMFSITLDKKLKGELF
jgi:drug/metabolite transporter (DMT)-like permease